MFSAISNNILLWHSKNIPFKAHIRVVFKATHLAPYGYSVIFLDPNLLARNPQEDYEAQPKESPWALLADYQQSASSALQLPEEISAPWCRRHTASRWPGGWQRTTPPANRKRRGEKADLFPGPTKTRRRWPAPERAEPIPWPRYVQLCSASSPHSANPLWPQCEPLWPCRPARPLSLKDGKGSNTKSKRHSFVFEA